MRLKNHMTKEMFEKIKQAGLFDYYRAKISDDATDSGIFVPDEDGHLVKITMDNLSEFFDIELPDFG